MQTDDMSAEGTKLAFVRESPYFCKEKRAPYRLNWNKTLTFSKFFSKKCQIYVVRHEKMFCKFKKNEDLCIVILTNNLFTLKN